MKKYVLAIAALGILAACSSKKEQKAETPIITEEEEMVVPRTQQVKPVNMRDSLRIEEGKGSVVERQYSGLLPGADVPGIEYDLTLFFQQDSENGVYALRMTYLEAEDGKDVSFWDYGKRQVVHGIPSDQKAIVYKLVSTTSDDLYNFLLTKEGDLILLQDDLSRIDTDLNYTLKLIK